MDLTKVMLMYVIKLVCRSIKNKKPLEGICKSHAVHKIQLNETVERIKRESDDENELNASLSGELNCELKVPFFLKNVQLLV